MTSVVAGLIWVLFGVIVLGFGALMVLEGILYWAHGAPITTYVRNWGYGHMFGFVLLAFLVVVGFTAAVTHFVVDGSGGG